MFSGANGWRSQTYCDSVNIFLLLSRYLHMFVPHKCMIILVDDIIP